ncbi:MAG TPA: hypothetical protein PKD11_01380 [Pyrinomonadaceae bacterium]|nr:hypothetical protein [Pyrinomonadaceae bacterium]
MRSEIVKTENLYRTLRAGLLTATILTVVFASEFRALMHSRPETPIAVTASFSGKEITPDERIVLTLSRPLENGEGRIAVLVASTDLTALFSISPTELVYTPRLFHYPIGESPVTVYRVSADGEWMRLAEFKLKVRNSAAEAGPDGAADNSAEQEGQAGRTAYGFTPNVTINIKGQNQTLTFPREAAPERNPSSEMDGQAGFDFKVTRRGWSLANKFDLVGVGARQNALRFGELQNEAPMIDLSSYLIEFGKDRFKVNLGHVSFGSNRHVINSFSSRGVSGVVPIGKQNEITFAAMNGTSVVGFDNFLGVSRRKHSVVGAGFAREFFKERPNGLRVEFTVMRGSLLPLTSFNEGNVTDAERSLGFGFTVKGSDTSERLRYEVSFGRSRFINPSDPLLEQDQQVTEIRETWRNSRFAEFSFDIFRDVELWKGKKLKLTGTYRHEEIQPLYRSIGASLQADRRQHQFEFSGNLGEINFAFGNLRDRDNLNEIASILKTLNRRNNVVIGIPLGSFFTPNKANKWLPAVSYTFDLTHQFGAFLPVDGEFRDPSQVPDQKSYSQAFNAQWIISERFSAGYRYTRAFQDNRQPGRELADFRSEVHGFTFGTKVYEDLDLDLEFSNEAQLNLEQPRTDKTFRVGSRATWRTPFIKNSIFSGGISFSLAGDKGNQNDARNAELDLQWAYRFAFGSKKFKKLDTQFFIRYANRYGSTIDRVFFVNSLNKTQVFNFGLTFNIF